MYSKFDGIGDDDDDHVAAVRSHVSAAARAMPPASREDTIKKLEDLKKQGKSPSMAELMAQMKALPTSAKEQLMEKLGPLAESLQQNSQPTPPSSSDAVSAKTAAEFASRLAADKSAFGLPKAVEREQEKREEVERRALINTNVVVSGLTGRPELNGHCGEVKARNAAKGRYAVKLASCREPILLKPVNVLPPEKAVGQKIDAPGLRES